MVIPSRLNSITNFVLLGESGSGKTEISVNLALNLAKNRSGVVFYDMDQTKSLFRARDISDVLTVGNVRIGETLNYMDSPLSPPGVENDLANPDITCILDVGGNAVGSQMIGKYHALLNESNTCYLYVINPYRPFSGNTEYIVHSMAAILSAAHIPQEKIHILINPCLGNDTDKDVVLSAWYRMLNELAEHGLVPAALTVRESLYTDMSECCLKIPLYPIKLHICNLYGI